MKEKLFSSLKEKWSMSFDYDIFLLVRKSTRYVRKTITADSLRAAVFELLMGDGALIPITADIYCMKKSGDLQLMGVYDGQTDFVRGGVFVSHVLKTGDGKSYMLTDNGFELL